jgi:hypothetical protein
MRFALVHLSDIHFQAKNNGVLGRLDSLVAGVCSVDTSARTFLIVVSGDIANSGDSQEYKVAQEFLGMLKQKIEQARPGSQIHIVIIPGNHDCVLPKEENPVREVLISGALQTLQDESPNKSLLKEVLKVQTQYEKFCKSFFPFSRLEDGICAARTLEIEDKRIQVNFYNTAILSRREERQGELLLPCNYIKSKIELGQKVDLSISLFHHSYVWLDSNNHLSFRNHIERTSDIAIMGHQHVPHNFYKLNFTGERILYIEGGALQDISFPHRSEFIVLMFDFDTREEMSVQFTWNKSVSMYDRKEEMPWRKLSTNKKIRSELVVSDDFEDFLQDIGFPCEHKLKGLLKLRDIFIYPDIQLKRQVPKQADDPSQMIQGSKLLKQIGETQRIVLQGATSSGKTSLAKILFEDMLNEGTRVPLLLDGNKIKSADEQKVLNSFLREFEHEYISTALERYRQLRREEKVLIIDNWHETTLNAEGRASYLHIVDNYFGKVILFTDELYQIQELADKSTKTLLEFQYATIQELGYVARGELIDRWMKFGREHIIKSGELAREIEETENFVQSVLGKNTLPSLPFIVLCILQVQQEDKPESPEAGSFGYLYEVLITKALSSTTGRKPQLEKKYTFLSILAFTLYKEDREFISSLRVHEIAKQYADSHLVQIDIGAILTDLKKARVLTEVEGNYSFAYPHLFHYFVARYFKENLGRAGGETLRAEINKMVSHVSSDRFSTILMFVLYLARDTSGALPQLVAMADKIYANVEPAELKDEVNFLEELSDHEDIDVGGDQNLEKNRKNRRELKDRVTRKSRNELDGNQDGLVYSDDLSEPAKFRFAYRHIELLGQVIRNFPGSLPGEDKLTILRASYLLGLRVLRTLLALIESSQDQLRKSMLETQTDQHAKGLKQQAERLNERMEELISYLGKLFALGMIFKIAGCVGAPDLEQAYDATLEQVGKSNATLLINLAIRLDHSREFPEEFVVDLHRELESKPFADSILKILVLSHIRKYGIDIRLRQRIGELLKLRTTAPYLMEPTDKKRKG